MDYGFVPFANFVWQCNYVQFFVYIIYMIKNSRHLLNDNEYDILIDR